MDDAVNLSVATRRARAAPQVITVDPFHLAHVRVADRARSNRGVAVMLGGGAEEKVGIADLFAA